MNFFSNWPELFSDRRVYRLETPLYIAVKGKERKFFYDHASYKSAQLDGKWEINYCKGLGSLDKEDYKTAINSPRLKLITADDASHFEKLEMAFGDDADGRKEWMMQ